MTVRTGADRILSDALHVIEGKKVAFLTNHTGRLSTGQHLIDAVAHARCCEITALFGPEHGIDGNTPDGNAIGHSHHDDLGVPVYSLYGKTHKPTPDMLRGTEVLVCDIQDVGVRFYTYISTVALAIEAAAEAGLPVVVLDRPAMIRGLTYDGPIRTPQLRSFVSLLPVPVAYGMTIGEVMTMVNAEGCLKNGVQADLTVVHMEGWRRGMWYDETQLPWIAPSPNLPRLETAIIYPGMCFVEGTSISEGRGTDTPFMCVGSPWADPDRLLQALTDVEVPGVSFSEACFVPRTIPGMAVSPKFEGEECHGIRVTITDRNIVEPVKLGIAVLYAFKRCHPEETILRNRRFDILVGSSDVRRMLESGARPDAITSSWCSALEAFGATRARYLSYS